MQRSLPNRPSSDNALCYKNCRAACNEAIFTWDWCGILNSYNNEAQKLFGYLPAETTGKRLCDFLQGGREELLRIHRVLENHGAVNDLETVILARDQKPIPVRLSAALLKGEDGHCSGVIAICHDLSELRNLETEIQQKDQFCASILKNSADAIFTLDSQERITSWNKGAEGIFGYSEEEMLGQSLEILVPQHLKEKRELANISAIARREGFLRSYQTQRVTKDGRLIDVLFTRTAIKDGQGNVVGFSSVLKDVTEQTLLDHRLAQMEKLSAIGEVAAGLAHEIKNPLAGIKGAIEVIHDGLSQDDPNRLILREVLSEVTRIDRSVMNLLSYSKPRKPHFTRVDLRALIGEVISLLQKMADSRRILLQSHLSVEIPLILGDENNLRQLFMNLILNSIEAIEWDGEVLIRLQVISDLKVRVEIYDSGPGIPEETLGKIFQPFYTSKKQGTGLGLATCKRIVLDHHGEIRVQSQVGQGACFSVDLPLNSVVPMSLSSY